MNARHLFAAVAIAICLPLQAATEVISLNHRMADELLPAARSVVGERGRVSGHGNQLIVNAPAEATAELRGLLEQLDKPPVRLLITVDSSATGFEQDRGHALSGTVGSERSSAQVRIIRHSTHTRGAGTQQIHASEGYPAFIQVGQSVPLTVTGTDLYGQPYQQTEHRDVMRGFYATATVIGDRVQVRISTVNDHLSEHRPDTVQVQRSETQLSGRLGEWITLGSHSDTHTSDSRETVRRYATSSAGEATVRLKIDRLD